MLAVVIPAVKKNVAFPDDLVKKLAGIPLMQRAIDNACHAFSCEQTHVITDSLEIDLLCSRSHIAAIYDKDIRLDPESYLECLRPHLLPLTEKWQELFILSPYVPLVGVADIRDAYQFFQERRVDYLVPVTRTVSQLYSPWERPLSQLFHGGVGQEFTSESRAFIILRSELLKVSGNHVVTPAAYPANGRLLEIRDFEDWWICEKLLKRRRIVFRVIGNKEVGMGHIFRCLALAHEITDHEIRFVCTENSGVAASKLAGYDYWLGIYQEEEIEQAIVDLQPDLVVNDILDTSADYIGRLKEHGIRVLNFEDLGSGAAEADLTINDLYDDPLLPRANMCWGHSWFFVRDEFADARPNHFRQQVQRILLTFGGTDPSDLTRQVLVQVAPYCAEHGIAIDVVTGDGYGHIEELQAMVVGMRSPAVTYNHAIGVISHIMEHAEIAICSNGRTVYELAHMNVPAIVVPHHAREATHRYACEANGFIPLSPFGTNTSGAILDALCRLVEDTDYRSMLFKRQQKANFTRNKRKVVECMLDLLCQGEDL